jgi:hypothetical protein
MTAIQAAGSGVAFGDRAGSPADLATARIAAGQIEGAYAGHLRGVGNQRVRLDCNWPHRLLPVATAMPTRPPMVNVRAENKSQRVSGGRDRLEWTPAPRTPPTTRAMVGASRAPSDWPQAMNMTAMKPKKMLRFAIRVRRFQYAES